jgi:hypothetical protein
VDGLLSNPTGLSPPSAGTSTGLAQLNRIVSSFPISIYWPPVNGDPPILPPATPLQSLTPLRRHVAPQTDPLSSARRKPIMSSPDITDFIYASVIPSAKPCARPPTVTLVNLSRQRRAHLLCHAPGFASAIIYLAHQTPILVQDSGLLSHPTLHLVYPSVCFFLLNAFNASKSLSCLPDHD